MLTETQVRQLLENKHDRLTEANDELIRVDHDPTISESEITQLQFMIEHLQTQAALLTYILVA